MSEIPQMMSPVQCAHCNAVYDLAGVDVIHRYGDCDVFKSPCCGRTVDSRPWKSMPDYERIDRGTLRDLIADTTAEGEPVALVMRRDGTVRRFRVVAP